MVTACPARWRCYQTLAEMSPGCQTCWSHMENMVKQTILLCRFNKLFWFLLVKNVFWEVLQVKIQTEIIFRFPVNGNVRQEWPRADREEVHFSGSGRLPQIQSRTRGALVFSTASLFTFTAHLQLSTWPHPSWPLAQCQKKWVAVVMATARWLADAKKLLARTLSTVWGFIVKFL